MEAVLLQLQTAFINLIQLTTPVVPTISTTAPTCLADGFSIITNYNAANTYTFSPSGPTVGVGGSISGTIIGTSYTVTASNGGCIFFDFNGIYQFDSINYSGSSNTNLQQRQLV